MAEKTSTATKAGNELAARSPRRESPPPAVLGLASTILGLQQTAGNRNVGRLLGGALLQPKLRIGPPGDVYEREADRVADTILREGGNGPVPVSVVSGGPGVQRMCAECEEETLQRSASAGEDLAQRQCHCQEEELVQPKADGGPSRSAPGFESRVAALRGSGRPLPSNVRGFFEPRFGHDFAAVRVHTGGSADEAAQAVHARAFTVGNDVAFASGEWSPETGAGQRLLAHELTHVVQQTPLVARRQPLLQRALQDAGAVAPQAETPAAAQETPAAAQEAPAPVPEPPTPAEPTPEAATADQAPAAVVVVEDDATEVGKGQMKKSEFLALLRPAVLAAAESGLSDKSHAEQASSYVDLWLGQYETKDAEQLNSDLSRLVAGEHPPTTAEGYIAAIAGRVRTAVATWERTGEPPPELSAGELPGAGGLLGGLGGVLFKALPGGARDPGSPRALRAQLGAGRPLDSGLRSRMESAIGPSFSRVRVHTDGQAAGLSHRLNARAFTVGEHVAFGAGEYRPGTLLGDALIAHELAHVAQQGGDAESFQPMRADGDASYGALERDADVAAAGAVASLWGLRLPGLSLPLRTAPRLSSGLRLQRCCNCGKSPKGKCVVKSGPTYTPNGTQTPPASAGKKSLPFDLQAEFEHDPSKGINAECCWVRQSVKWDAVYAAHHGGPPHPGFPSSAKADTWYEDRDTAGKMYGHRTGSESECVSGNHYEDSSGSEDCCSGVVYKGADDPGTSSGGVWDFDLQVIDVCNGDKQVGASDTIKINW
jgi:hypothetical protein